jgi:hypothetical protein
MAKEKKAGPLTGRLWAGISARQMPRAIAMAEAGISHVQIALQFKCELDWVKKHLPTPPDVTPPVEPDKPEPPDEVMPTKAPTASAQTTTK